MPSLTKYLAEMFGTFVLVFIGCGSAVLAGTELGYLGIALAFGLTLSTMVYTIGSISGCHINPAVTLGFFVNKKIGIIDTIAYVIFQCIGAILGSGILYFLAIGNSDYSLAENGLGQNGYGSASPGGYDMLSGFAAEIILTFIFVIVILGSTHEHAYERFAGIAIGFSLFLVHLIGIPITGTSVNPARSLGPAVLLFTEDTTAMEQLWVFWAAPLLGALLAGLAWGLYARFLSDNDEM